MRSRSPSNCSTQSTRCSSTRGPAMLPVLGHVADEDQRDPAPLGDLGQRAGRLAHLGDGPGRAAAPLAVEGLDRVDHAGLGLLGLERRHDVLQRGLGQRRDRQRHVAEARGAQPDLGRRLLAGDVERAGGRPPARLASAIPVSVLLPIPGDPPSRTSEPGTRPPPSTRSSSPTPVLRRSVELAADVAQQDRLGRAAPARRPPRPREAERRAAPRRACSTPRSPAQRPDQARAACPQ